MKKAAKSFQTENYGKSRFQNQLQNRLAFSYRKHFVDNSWRVC